jgi:hypothetical protein
MGRPAASLFGCQTLSNSCECIKDTPVHVQVEVREKQIHVPLPAALLSRPAPACLRASAVRRIEAY